MMNDRFECTKEIPWQEGYGRAVHSEAIRIGGEDNYWESYDILKCPNCGVEFKIYYEE